MQVTQLNSIRWSSAEKKGVIIEGNIIDSDGTRRNDVVVSTPYDDTSIIWDYVKQIPVEQIGDYAPPPPQDFIPDILEKRLYLLRASDWTQLADVPLSAEKKAEWEVYRQALRDITLQAGYPENVTFPTEPV